MDLNNIKDIIRSLKIEEQLHVNKLENIKKSSIKKDQKLKNKSISAINKFELLLDDLSHFYHRNNKETFDNNSIFISEHDLKQYELLETDIQDLLDIKLQNLKLMEEKNENFEPIDKSLETKFQKSLFLKHQTKMNEIELQAELAGIDAQINWLTAGCNDKIIINEQEQITNNDLDLLKDEISELVKNICCDESLMTIYSDVDKRLQSQNYFVQLIDQLIEQYRGILVRQQLRLDALMDELRFHGDVKDVLDSLTELEIDLNNYNNQLGKMNVVIGNVDVTSSKNEQLLMRYRSNLSDKLPTNIDNSLVNVDSMINSLANENAQTNDVITMINNDVFASIQLFDEIYNMVANVDKICRQKRSKSTANNRSSMVNKENRELFALKNIAISKIKTRLKEIMKTQESLKVKVDFYD